MVRSLVDIDMSLKRDRVGGVFVHCIEQLFSSFRIPPSVILLSSLSSSSMLKKMQRSFSILLISAHSVAGAHVYPQPVPPPNEKKVFCKTLT